MNIYIWNRL